MKYYDNIVFTFPIEGTPTMKQYPQCLSLLQLWIQHEFQNEHDLFHSAIISMFCFRMSFLIRENVTFSYQGLRTKKSPK